MLFLQELKKIVISLPYLVFVAAVAVGLFSQGVFQFKDHPLREPQPGGGYGYKYEEIPEVIMPAALQDLWAEFKENSYTTYPIGFVKCVKLDAGKQEEIAGILSEITGSSPETIAREANIAASDPHSFQIGGDVIQQDGGFTIGTNGGQPGGVDTPVAVRDGLGYPQFQELMGRVDSLLGGGSNYAADSLVGYGAVPLTYEEANGRYDLAVKVDKVTGGYARLFADYAGVMTLSFLPVFLAVILSMKDRRARMEFLVYAKEVSSARLTWSRYLALVVAAMLPVIPLSYLSNVMVWDLHSGMGLDYLAPLRYDLGWLMPSVMVSTAAGMFLTELTGTPIAIAVQGLWWMFDVNLGIKTVRSGYSLLRLAPRHNAGVNSWFRTQDYLDHFQDLLQNRLLMAGVSLLLAILTILLYEAKRKGKLGGKASFPKRVFNMGNRPNKHPAYFAFARCGRSRFMPGHAAAHRHSQPGPGWGCHATGDVCLPYRRGASNACVPTGAKPGDR